MNLKGCQFNTKREPQQNVEDHNRTRTRNHPPPYFIAYHYPIEKLSIRKSIFNAFEWEQNRLNELLMEPYKILFV